LPDGRIEEENEAVAPVAPAVLAANGRDQEEEEEDKKEVKAAAEEDEEEKIAQEIVSGD
jgi:hypothetical protein